MHIGYKVFASVRGNLYSSSYRYKHDLVTRYIPGIVHINEVSPYFVFPDIHSAKEYVRFQSIDDDFDGYVIHKVVYEESHLKISYGKVADLVEHKNASDFWLKSGQYIGENWYGHRWNPPTDTILAKSLVVLNQVG